MDSEGNIYMLNLQTEEDRARIVEELELVLVPEEELPRVANLSQKEKKAWYKEHKDLEPVAQKIGGEIGFDLV